MLNLAILLVVAVVGVAATSEQPSRGIQNANVILDLESGLSAAQNTSDAKRPVKIEALIPEFHPNATRVRLYFGPFTLPGANRTALQKRQHQHPPEKTEGITFNTHITGFCTNCTVLAGKADLHFLNGTRATVASGIYNHHLLVIDQTKRLLPWYLCSGQTDLGSSKSSGFLITGVAEATNRFSVPAAPFTSGYLLPAAPAHSFQLNAELINYRRSPLAVYVTAETEYLPGVDPRALDASMSLLSITGCTKPDFRIPAAAERWSAASPPVRMPRGGFVLPGEGHVHDGGERIDFRVNNRTVCSSRAVYGGEGSQALLEDGSTWETIGRMTPCGGPPLRVEKGDEVSVEAVYDLAAHPQRRAAGGGEEFGDAMGTFFLNFAADK
jgi:hypothetical protein